MKPEIKQRDITSWIQKAGKTEQIGEFQYPYLSDFYVLIAFGSRAILNQIRQLALEPYTDRRTRTKEDRLNDEKLQLGYAERIVKGWRGLNVEGLNTLIPGTTEEALTEYEKAKAENAELVVPTLDEIKKVEVVYSVETATELMGNSIDFMNWIVEMAGNSENYSKIGAQKKEEYDNLKN